MRFIAAAAIVVALINPAQAQHWGRNDGGGFLGGLIGGAVGGVVGGMLRPPPYYPPPVYYPPPPPTYQPYAYPPDQVAWCMQRYRSYNPQTGFFVGFDNQLHRCPNGY